MHQELADLAGRYWDYLAEMDPDAALMRGDHRFDDQVPDLSRDTENDRIAKLDDFAAAATAVDDTGLSADERITRAVLAHDAHAHAEELRSRYAEFDVNPVLGYHAMLLSYAPQFPITEPEHADALVTKYGRLGDTFDQWVFRLRQGVARDRTPPRVSVEKSIAQIDEYLAGPLDADPFIAVRSPETFDAAREASWREALKEAVADSIRPGYQRLRAALASEILDKARPPERSGLRWLPDGEEVYARAVARHTTLEVTPLEVHTLGLEAIERLGDEYRRLGGEVLGTTDLAEIFDRLRTDPALRFTDAASVRSAAEAGLARAKAAIGDWFGRLPRADCVVEEIPEVAAKDATLAFYLPPATDGSRPGTYFINVYDPTSRTIYESEALAFHESIPGHHLQIAIAQELEDIPEFRRNLWITAYGEGWGLYTERLCDEMGLYSDDTARLGILSFDSWRAGRLVVDTGMHALGWSRDEAIRYLADNSPQALNNVENEVDRYIGWPGQALAYTMGQREIIRLRTEAKQTMGDRFDIKGFHDTVLGSGPVPLPILGELVRAWASD